MSIIIIFSKGNTCVNSVLGIRYLLIWNGGNLTQILVRILLNDLDLANNQIVKQNQLFETKWLHETTAVLYSVNSITKYDEVIEKYDYIKTIKSGNKGYLYGRPLISGYLNTNNENDLVDISYKNRISTFKMLNGNLCGSHSNLERSIIKFGHNTTSSCMIRLTKKDLSSDSSCKCLKKIIFDKFNDYYLPSNFISKNGNPNITSYIESEWINIYPKDIRLLKYTNISSDTLNTCRDVPYKMTLWIFYADVGKTQNEPIYEVVASEVK
jgi:hypothetical protein